VLVHSLFCTTIGHCTVQLSVIALYSYYSCFLSVLAYLPGFFFCFQPSDEHGNRGASGHQED